MRCVITACGRPDLLVRTLQSFVDYFDEPIRAFIVVEDSGTDCNSHLKPEFPQVTWLTNERNIGQIISIDKAYETVTTPYIFHCEEDFPLLKGFKLSDSRNILEKHPKILTVVLWGHGQPYGLDPQCLEDGTLLTTVAAADYFHSFTFNPGLRRMSDYLRHGPYSRLVRFDREHAANAEKKLALYHKNAGYRLAYAQSFPTVKHIGYGRHVGGKTNGFSVAI